MSMRILNHIRLNAPANAVSVNTDHQRKEESVTLPPRAFQIQGNPQDITTLKWVYILPSTMKVAERSTWLQEMYETFYRMMFLTRRKIWIKNKQSGKEQRIILVVSPHPLDKCGRMWLKKKGFPIKANGCTRDSCFTCRGGVRIYE